MSPAQYRLGDTQASAELTVLNTLIMPKNTASTHTSPHTLYTFVVVTPSCEHLLPIYAKHHDAEGGRSCFCLCAASAEGHYQETAAGAQGRIQGMVIQIQIYSRVFNVQ